MSDMFIPSELLDENENASLRDGITKVEKQLNAVEKTQMRGYVCGIYENRDGRREVLDLDHNHIVLCGRKWLMQRAVGGSMKSEIIEDVAPPHEWSIKWFGVGQGGANSSDVFSPFYTPDQQTDLISRLTIFRTYKTDFKYADQGRKKTFEKYDGVNAQMKYDVINSEVVALFHLVIDFDDCPYPEPYLGVKLNELALYASPSEDPEEENFVMFSRYCFPTKFKSIDEKYTFLWYIYF